MKDNTMQKGQKYKQPNGIELEYSHSDQNYDYFHNEKITEKCWATYGVSQDGRQLIRYAKSFSQTFILV